ncbi:MAG: hypothetical protein Q7U53_14455 [Anaerolineaceae bacterium]|nr:hypothetical protein [Anaerolineaceae bacterium]
MKRGLLIVMFGLILVAAWFRWFDEIEPEMVKEEAQIQLAFLKERFQDFSLKAELAQINSALDSFFSPKEELVEDEMVLVVETEMPEKEPVWELTITDENLVPEEELSVSPTEEHTTEPAELPVEVQPTMESAITVTEGYPAPGMAPALDYAAVAEPSEAPQEATETESSLMEFNQLQETVPGSFLPYDLQSVEPLYMANFVHPEEGCNWMGVAGQIFDENLQPKDGMVVVVEGVVNNTMVEFLGFSGLAQTYGPGGYELVLSQGNSPGIFWIQLFDVAGNPLSGIYSFQMDGTCEKNLAVINFSIKSDAESKYVPTVTP